MAIGRLILAAALGATLLAGVRGDGEGKPLAANAADIQMKRHGI